MNTNSNHGYKPLYVFLIILALISSFFWIPIGRMHSLYAGEGTYMQGLMWAPGIAGIITALIFKIPLLSFGWNWGKTRYQVWSLVTPLLYILAAYIVIWTVGWGIFYDEESCIALRESFGMEEVPMIPFLLIYVLLTSLFSLSYSASTAIGEEIGWRGFLYSQLEGKMSYTKIALLTGAIWSLWHVPVLRWSDYNNDAPFWYTLVCFVPMVMALSFIFTWFRVKSGSLWTGVILHASHNMYETYVFTPITLETDESKYYIGEFGIILPAVCCLTALGFWIYHTRTKQIAVVEERLAF